VNKEAVGVTTKLSNLTSASQQCQRKQRVAKATTHESGLGFTSFFFAPFLHPRPLFFKIASISSCHFDQSVAGFQLRHALFHMSQHKAQGTSLTALLAPIGALAFWEYYKAGNVDLKAGLLIALGFLVGGYFGGCLF